MMNFLEEIDEIHAIIARNKKIQELLYHQMQLFSTMTQAADAYFTAAITVDRLNLNNTKEEAVLDATMAAVIDICPPLAT